MDQTLCGSNSYMRHTNIGKEIMFKSKIRYHDRPFYRMVHNGSI